jgi:hypothetical protein
MSHSGQWSAKSGAHYLAPAVEIMGLISLLTALFDSR